MRRPATPFLTLLLAVGCSDSRLIPKQLDGSADGAALPPLTSRSSYEVSGAPLFTSTSGPLSASSITLPSQVGFLLFIDPTRGQLVVGSHRLASRVPLTTADGVSFTAKEAVHVALDGVACGATLTFSSFEAHLTGQELVAGRAHGTAEIIQGDVAYSYDVDFPFSGARDTQGPRLAWSGDVDPLGDLRFELSEPLPAGTSALLRQGTETVALIPSVGSGEDVTAFSVPADVVLRYATDYGLEITPWVDLAGNAGVDPGPLTTSPLPPLFPQDGFESGGARVGGAQVVDASILPPIVGARSAIIAAPYLVPQSAISASQQLTVRMPVNSGDSSVTLVVRPLGTYVPASTYGTRIRAAVPGGTWTTVTLPGMEILDASFIAPTGQMVMAGPVRPLVLPLPAGTSSEVIFDVRYTSPPGCGLASPAASYLIDDLRVE